MSSILSRKIALLTREYPPEIYGGAGVHVEHLSLELSKLVDLGVHCFGQERHSELVAKSYRAWAELGGEAPELGALRTLSVDLRMASELNGYEVVHSHTWYTNFAGHLAKLLYGAKHVLTTHSLEPLRPWKAEQLRGGYALSSFCEKTAISAADCVIAVSQGMRRDILACYPEVDEAKVAVVHNGVDPQAYRPNPRRDALARFGIEAPYVVFVGRITRQKGILHFLDAAEKLDKRVNVVLCAGEPDTVQIGEEVRSRVAQLSVKRTGITLIEEMLPRELLTQILSHASAFVCPSVYEPFGIVNLEAMGCGVPVVASNVGGIPEIVVHESTGFLIDYVVENGVLQNSEQASTALAMRLNELATNPELVSRMGQAGRERVISQFSWASIARETASLYAKLLDTSAG